MPCREVAPSAVTSSAANAVTAASVVKTEPPAAAHPSPELTAHAVSCSSLSGSDGAATRVAGSPGDDNPAAAAATVAESVVSPRTVAATLVRISVRSADGVTSTPDGEHGSFDRRSGSSEQCHPDGATEAALAMRHGNVSNPGALPAAGGRASPTCAAAPAFPVPLWPALGRLPFPPAAFEGGYQNRASVQQQQGQAAEAAVRGLDTSTILQQAAELTANAVGNRLWDLAPSALLAMHKQVQQHEQQHEQQHGSLGVSQPATSGLRVPDCSALASQGQQPAMQLLPARPESTPFAAHDLFMRGGGVHPLALLHFQQQLAAVQQQQPRHLEQLLAPHADRAELGAHHDHHTLAMASEAFNSGHGGRNASGAPPIRTGLQSSSASAPADGAADRSGRRVVSGNEAAPRGAAQDHRINGVGRGQAVTLQDMQQAAVALVQQHRQAMAQQGSPGRVKLPPPDDEGDPCASTGGYSGCCT